MYNKILKRTVFLRSDDKVVGVGMVQRIRLDSSSGEGDTKIEQIQPRRIGQKFWGFGSNIIIECPLS